MLKGIFLILGASGLAQAISLLSSPVLSRLYEPEAFGLLSIIIALSGIGSVVCIARYDMAILVTSNVSRMKAIVQICFLLMIASIPVLLLVSFFLYLYYGSIGYILVPVAILLVSINNILDKIANWKQDYKKMSSGRVLKVISDVTIAVSFGFFSVEYGLIAGFLFGFTASSLYLYKSQANLINFKNLKYRYLRVVAIKYNQFPKYYLPHSILNSINTNALILLIPLFYGGNVLGLFAFGYRIFQAPIGLISKSLQSVMFRRMSIDMENNRTIWKSCFKVLLLMLLVFFVLLPLLIHLSDIFELFFGPQWVDSALFVQIVSPWLLTAFVGSQYSFLPIVTNKQNIALRFEFLSFMTRLSPFGFMVISGNEFEFIDLLSVLSLSSTVVSFLIIAWYISILCKYEREVQTL